MLLVKAALGEPRTLKRVSHDEPLLDFSSSSTSKDSSLVSFLMACIQAACHQTMLSFWGVASCTPSDCHRAESSEAKYEQQLAACPNANANDHAVRLSSVQVCCCYCCLLSNAELLKVHAVHTCMQITKAVPVFHVACSASCFLVYRFCVWQVMHPCISVSTCGG